MNIHKLRMDTSGNVEDISFVLAKKNGDKLGNIVNVDNIVAKHSMKEASDITFVAYKKMNDNIIKCWNDIKDFKLVWVPEWDMWYEITVEVNEKDENIKKVSGKTLGEAELSQIMLYGIEINTETDIAREDYKIPTTFYNPDHPEASLMDRLLTDKAPHYKVKHIDKSLMNLQRTFTFDDTSIYDALQEVSEELDCLFIFECGSDENGKPERTISVYDLEANCVDCGNRDTFVHKCPKCGSTNIILGYGEYTNVFISRDNLADEITYSVDTDSVKNCMKLEAGDDLMTAAIRSCNPNGTDYIYYFPDETREEMSPELQEKLKSYDALYEKYQSDYNFTINDSFVTNYNALVNKYKTYEESLKDTEIKNPITGYPKLMRIYFDTIDMVQLLRNKLMPPVDKPDNNAKSQGEYLMANLPSSASTTSLKNLSVSTADNIMVMLAQSIIKGVFKVTVTNTTLSNNVWKGKFNLENYADKDDKFTSQFVLISINENYESYVKQRIDSILARSDENYYDIVGLFKQDMAVFKSQLKKYCLNTLQIFQKCCQSCIDMMVQQGISSNSTSSIYGINTKVLYENVYIPYYNKMNAIQDEIKVREDELYTVEGKYNNQNQLVQDGIQIEIERIITEVQDALNFKNYIGIDLYKEFSSFIRMDKFSNDNYISDGLNNTDLMKNAIEFITVATKELFKSATLQHSITGTIKNFLRMKEFEPVTNNFKNGNWICVGIDDKVYQLRIIEYEIDFSDTQNISVTFSDIIKLPDGMSYYERLEEAASKMATSYNGVVRQSTINTDFKNKMNEMIVKGLSMTNTKIVSNADNQDITWDEHGLLCREYDDIISDYTDSQLKIINHGIYITDDNWKTARAGIGNFIYYDPKDKTYKESYGVIADTLVSNLILTSEVGIYNEEKSIEMAKDGIIVTTNTMNKNVFTIRKEITDDEGNITYERQLYIDDNGNIVLGGNASISWDNVTGTDNVVVKDTLDDLLSKLNKELSDKIINLEEQTDKKAETWYQSSDPSSQWKTDDVKKQHKGDIWYDTKNQVTKIYNKNGWEDTKTTPPDEVFDKIDGKAQIFVEQPKPPYAKGDLWVNGVDILTCINPRTSGSYTSSDWAKKNTYTDDSFAKQVQQNLNNLKIGGRNFLSKTSKTSSISTSYNNTATGFSAIDIYGTIGCNDNKQNGKTLADLGYQIGDEYTISFDYVVSQNSSKQIVLGTYILEMRLNSTYVYTLSSRIQLQSSGHVNISFKIANENQLKVNNLCVRIDNSTCVFTVSNAKLEKGNKATDWTPAPEDTESYVDNLASDLQEQIDGKIETFNQTTDPSSTWTTTNIKTQHKGDIWYNPNTKITQRYSGTVWETLYNKEAQEASTLAQKKAQVFVSTPTVPYYKGDLWFGGATGDIKTCTNTRVSGSYTASDWTKYNKYTDDSSLTTFIKGTYTTDVADIRDQIDGKIETFRQESDPSSAWKTTDDKKKHIGDLWYNTKNQTSSMYNGKDWETVTSSIPDAVWSQIGSKAQIFTDTPKPEYNKGDLWIVGANGVDANKKYANEILTCITSKADGTSFSINDWTKQNKYTDDTTANTIKNDILGSTYIDKQWVIAPNIKGGHLLIVGKDSSGNIVTSAEITSAGVLKATGAEITGKIIATDGVFSGSLNAAKGTFTGTLSGVDGSFTGTLSGATGNFTGDITATSIYAQNDYRVYASGKDKYIKAIWCGDNWEPTDGIADLYMGNQEKSWIEFIDYTSSTIQFTRKTSIISQYATTAKTNRSSVSCVTDQDTTYVQLLTIRNDVPAEVRLQIANDSGLCLIPGDVNDSTLAYDETIKLGTKSHKWMQVWTKNLYANGDTVRFSGISAKSSTRYLVIDSSGNVGYRDGSGGSELSQEYAAGTGIKIVNSKISLTGTTKDNNRYVKSPIDGTLHMSNGCGWDLVNTDNKEVTGIYCNNSNQVIISEKDYTTILRGSSIQLGNSNTIVSIPYLKNYTSASKYLVADDSGNIGWRSVTQGKTYSLANASTYGVMCLYNSTGSYTDGTMTQKAITEAINNAGGGGSSSTNMLEYGSYSSEWVLTSDSKSTYLVFRPSYVGSYKAYLGDGDHLWQKLNCQASPQVYSDRNVKDDIKYLSEYQLNLDKFFFDLKPVSYHLKTDTDNNEHHYGLIAQDVEKSFIKNHIEDYASYGILSKIKLSKPNVVGLTEQYMLSYEEFIPINIMMTQKAHHRIDSLTQENQKLKNTILSLQGEIAIIKQKLEELA